MCRTEVFALANFTQTAKTVQEMILAYSFIEHVRTLTLFWYHFCPFAMSFQHTKDYSWYHGSLVVTNYLLLYGLVVPQEIFYEKTNLVNRYLDSEIKLSLVVNFKTNWFYSLSFRQTSCFRSIFPKKYLFCNSIPSFSFRSCKVALSNTEFFGSKDLDLKMPFIHNIFFS